MSGRARRQCWGFWLLVVACCGAGLLEYNLGLGVAVILPLLLLAGWLISGGRDGTRRGARKKEAAPGGRNTQGGGASPEAGQKESNLIIDA